jgi:hypothetical protein
MIFILCLFLILYLVYEKHSETKQIEAISKMDWLTHEEAERLIEKVKE